MAATSGPTINNRGILILLDENNSRSFSENRLTNISTNETETGYVSSSDGYIYVQPVGIGTYSTPSLQGSQDISISTRIRHSQSVSGIKGAVFSMQTPHNQNDTRLSTSEPRTIFNLAATGSTLGGNAGVSSNLIVAQAPLTANVISTGSNATDNVIITSNNTVYSRSIANLIATSSVFESNLIAASNLSVPSLRVVDNLTATNTTMHYSFNSQEISLFVDDSGIVIRNKMPDYDVTMSYGAARGSDQIYTVNYSVGTDNDKIQLYVNSTNVLNSGNISVQGVIDSGYVQLFSVNGWSNYLNSGFKNILIYNKKLSQQDVDLFQNLKGN